jgi:uncharacterized protein YkwD
MSTANKVAVAFALVSCLFAAAPAQAAPTSPERAILVEINRVRVANGVRPLRVDDRLERSARTHSTWMLRTGVFTHRDVRSRLLRFGARGPRFGENLAWGAGGPASPQWFVQSWLNSPSHRANLLRPGFTRVGLGLRVGSFAGYGGASVLTANFAGR